MELHKRKREEMGDKPYNADRITLSAVAQSRVQQQPKKKVTAAIITSAEQQGGGRMRDDSLWRLG